MRHRVPGNRLSRAQDQRKAILRSLATELLRHDEIITTFAKAKAVQPEVERLITKGKKGYLSDYDNVAAKAKKGDAEAARKLANSLHLRRQVSAFVYDKSVVKKLFDEIVPRYKERKGGYSGCTRIIKAGFRRGDATPMAIIQLV
jgi:large subunit ribosomal protein L17